MSLNHVLPTSDTASVGHTVSGLEVPAGYAEYSALLADANREHAPRQGMDVSEYGAAIARADTVMVPLLGSSVEVPVSTAYDVLDWSSRTYVEKEYGAELGDGGVHRVESSQDFLERVDTQGLTERASELATRDSVLLIDYPIHPVTGSDDDPADYLVHVLEESGLSVAERNVIGRQHYFHGEIVMADREAVHDGPYDLRDGYRNGNFDKYTEGGIVMMDTLDDEQIEEAWSLYQEYIEALNLNTPVQESLDYNEFVRDMKSPDAHKFVGFDDGKIVSMLFMSPSVEKYGWLSQEHLQKKFGEKIEKGGVLEVPCLFTEVSKRGSAYTGGVIQLFVDVAHAAGADPDVTFDCPDETYQTVTNAIEKAINGKGDRRPGLDTASIEIRETTTQVYEAIKLAA